MKKWRKQLMIIKTLEAKQLVEFQKQGQQNAQAGAAFLAENAKNLVWLRLNQVCNIRY